MMDRATARTVHRRGRAPRDEDQLHQFARSALHPNVRVDPNARTELRARRRRRAQVEPYGAAYREDIANEYRPSGANRVQERRPSMRGDVRPASGLAFGAVMARSMTASPTGPPVRRGPGREVTAISASPGWPARRREPAVGRSSRGMTRAARGGGLAAARPAAKRRRRDQLPRAVEHHRRASGRGSGTARDAERGGESCTGP